VKKDLLRACGILALTFFLNTLSDTAFAEQKNTTPPTVKSQSANLSEEIIYDNNPEWLADKARLEKLSNDSSSEHACQVAWDILWPWAKRGNLEARLTLSHAVMFGGWILPNSTADVLSIMRDFIILSVHGTGYKEKKDEHTDEISDQAYSALSRIFDRTADDFLLCIKKSRTQECAHTAAEDRLVPPFDEYAEQIDFALAHGKKVRCLGSIGDHIDNEGRIIGNQTGNEEKIK
jgi:hypothetical protein